MNNNFVKNLSISLALISFMPTHMSADQLNVQVVEIFKKSIMALDFKIGGLMLDRMENEPELTGMLEKVKSGDLVRNVFPDLNKEDLNEAARCFKDLTSRDDMLDELLEGIFLFNLIYVGLIKDYKDLLKKVHDYINFQRLAGIFRHMAVLSVYVRMYVETTNPGPLEVINATSRSLGVYGDGNVGVLAFVKSTDAYKQALLRRA